MRNSVLEWIQRSDEQDLKAPARQLVSSDAAGRVTGVISPTAIRTKTLYDGLGRTSAVLAPAQGQEPTRTISSVVYDGLSRPKTTTTYAENGGVFSTRTLSYDLASRVGAEVLSGAVPASACTVYDDLDRVTSRTESGPAGGASFSYTYDPASLPLTESTTAFGRTWTVVNEYSKTNESWVIQSGTQKYYLSFAGAGGLSNLWAPGIGFQQRSYDVYGRLTATRLATAGGGTATQDLAQTSLAYDSRGRISSHRMLSSTLDASETFGYDTADRLKTWSRTGTGAGSATYAYDSSGNLTTATVSGVTTTFTSDAENRLTRSVAGSIVTTFTNDLYGRRTARITPSGTTTYTWDPSGHLSSVTSADTTVTYAYGITGMRESKTIERSGQATTWTKSVWSGSALAAEFDSDGTRYTYLWGPDRTPLSVSVEYSTGATETYAYHTDALGSVVAMTDSAGSVVARYAYGPYGACTLVTGDPIAQRNPLRYRAYYSDAETGMFYLPARYYDPATYRFLSQDPAAPSAGDPLSLNAYAYCLGDPVGASDPSGAIALYDDDNHVDSYEVAAHNYTHTKGASRNRWRKAALGRQKEWAAKRATAALNRRSVAMDAFFGRWSATGATRVAPGSTTDWESGSTSVGVPWFWSGSYNGLGSPNLANEASSRVIERQEAHYSNTHVYFKPFVWQAWHDDGGRRWVTDHVEHRYQTGLYGYGRSGYGAAESKWMDLTLLQTSWREGDPEW
ncbi:MAG: RHS repeat-associated core domain-containing protein [Coriobacteriia bacterium]